MPQQTWYPRSEFTHESPSLLQRTKNGALGSIVLSLSLDVSMPQNCPIFLNPRTPRLPYPLPAALTRGISFNSVNFPSFSLNCSTRSRWLMLKAKTRIVCAKTDTMGMKTRASENTPHAIHCKSQHHHYKYYVTHLTICTSSFLSRCCLNLRDLFSAAVRSSSSLLFLSCPSLFVFVRTSPSSLLSSWWDRPAAEVFPDSSSPLPWCFNVLVFFLGFFLSPLRLSLPPVNALLLDFAIIDALICCR